MKAGVRLILLDSTIEVVQGTTVALVTSIISGGYAVFGPAPVYLAGSYEPTVSNSGSYTPIISKTSVGD